MRRILLLACATALLAGCSEGTYTMYRSNVADPKKREHFATFDASEGEQYNAANCDLASRLLLAQPRSLIRFWCEKGAYKP